MKILFDTNVILDVLLAREKFVDVSSQLFVLVEKKQIEGYLCATTVTTLDYLIAKVHSKKLARKSIKSLLSLFHIADVNAAVLNEAVQSDFSDFEDAVQYYSGEFCGTTGLVTRNRKDFKTATSPVYTPDELLALVTKRNH